MLLRLNRLKRLAPFNFKCIIRRKFGRTTAKRMVKCEDATKEEYERVFQLAKPYFPEMLGEKYLRRCKDILLDPEDVVISGYNKSGTTWLENVVYLLCTNGDESFKFSREAVVWYELDRQWDGDKLRMPPPEIAEQMKPHRLFKQHLAWQLTPRQGDNTFVHIVRNGKDAATSYYHFEKGKVNKADLSGGGALTWDSYVEKFLHGHTRLGSWFTHTRDWSEASINDQRVLLVLYEDMIGDLKSVCQQINMHCNFGRTDFEIDKLLPKMDFEYMKARNAYGPYDPKWKILKDDFQFFRKGKVGQYKECWTDKQNKLYKQEYEKYFGRLDLWENCPYFDNIL